MTESPVETLEKAIVLRLFWTEGLTSFWHIERCAEFISSKGDDAWLFVKIDRNTNITVQINKGRLASRLSFSSVRTVLPSLVYIPELSLIPTQVPDFNDQTRVSNGLPRCNLRIYPRFLPQLEKTHKTSPSPRDEARFPRTACRAITFSQSNT